MKPCGHVTCKTCTDTLVKPAKQCIVCDSKLEDKDVISLMREGTFTLLDVDLTLNEPLLQVQVMQRED